MNSSLVFVLLLVFIVTCGQLVKTWMLQKNETPETDSELEDTLAKIDRLEERIKVLERIVTENRFDLKKEIDSL
jgi:hypothetical protein